MLSFWFSCDERRRFSNFLDGELHLRFLRQEEEEAVEKGQASSSASDQALHHQDHHDHESSNSEMGEL